MTISRKAAATDARAVAGKIPSRSPTTRSRTAHADPRWAATCSALDALRQRHRRAVRIVDAGCACGTLLIAAVRQARTLGFTAIEGHGIDGSPAMIGRARAAAARLNDPAIGLSFEVADVFDALPGGEDLLADIVLWPSDPDGDDRPGTCARLDAAGDVIVCDRHGFNSKAMAA